MMARRQLCLVLLIGGLARAAPAGVPSSPAPTSPTLAVSDAGSSPPAVIEETEYKGPHWKPLPISNPPTSRTGHLMVYETDRQRLLLFGGFLESRTLGSDTWESDGQKWEHINVTGPRADAAYVMAYDTGRGVAVLYGGRQRETWEFDGSEWRKVAPAHSPPITGFGAMAYDSHQRVVVLFGGEAASARGPLLPDLSDEVWRYDGSDWTKIEAFGPSPRKYHQMAYDSARERFVMFGGFDMTMRNDTWELRESGWQRVEPPAPPRARRGFAMTYDPSSRRTVLFGGFPGGDELWAFDGLEWTLISTTQAPSSREGAAMAFIPTRRRLFLFGGLTNQLLNDGWELVYRPPAVAPQVPPPLPVPRGVATEDVRLPGGRSLLIPLIPPLPDAPAATGTRREGKATTISTPAGLRFENARAYPRQMDPSRVVTLTGLLYNDGATDLSCRIEFWLSISRNPFDGEQLLCRPEIVQVKSGQSYDLREILRVVRDDVPPGEYYLGLELDRPDQPPDHFEGRNVYVIDKPYSISGRKEPEKK